MFAKKKVKSAKTSSIFAFVGLSLVAAVLVAAAVTPAIAVSGLTANSTLGVGATATESVDSSSRGQLEQTQDRFIGRQRQLIDANEAVEGLLHRFKHRSEARGSQGVKLIWVHGFGGMGKSWFLHRVRYQAANAEPALRALVVDVDPRPNNAWREPLRDLPRRAEDVFEPIAYRLAQLLGVEAADLYWQQKAQVAASAEEYRRMHHRFHNQLELAKGIKYQLEIKAHDASSSRDAGEAGKGCAPLAWASCKRQ